MQKVGRFFKVSEDQFAEAMRQCFPNYTDEEIHGFYEQIKLPRRATSGSGGYDFFAPFPFSLSPGNSIKIPTGIRVGIDPGWWLACLPRSSLGFKYRFQLDNTVGVIDSDYFLSDNEGHIFFKCTYAGPGPEPTPDLEDVLDCSFSNKWAEWTEKNKLKIAQGGAFAQAIFLPFGITYDDDATEMRNGGFGSTDKKEAST